MRLKIVLRTDKPHAFTQDYNEALTALIYRLITDSDKTFGEELHSKGYRQLGKKRFNFFTYSRLMTENKEWLDKYIPSGNIVWYFSSLIDDITIHFAKGLQRQKYLQIYQFKPVLREISIIKDAPNFAKGAIFTTLSPVVMTLRVEDGYTKFLKPEMMITKLKTNLIQKYYTAFNAVPYNLNLQIQFLDFTDMSIKYKTNNTFLSSAYSDDWQRRTYTHSI